MPDQTPNVYPFTSYADPQAALEWLSRAFAFEELAVYRSDEGAIRHAEVALGPGIVMFGEGDPNADQAKGIYVAVEDADAHYERAKAAGAEILREIEDTDYGSRAYTARDPEGNVWSFGTYQPKVG
jgi:uncharacterized glyoxalase superfamily protein PhnB